MCIKAKDAVFNRWLLDSEFRNLLDNTPEVALTGYDLTRQEREILIETLSRPKRYARRTGQARENSDRTFPTYFEN